MHSSDWYNVYCTDCVTGAIKYIADNSVDLIITDPPYGISGDKLHRHYHRNEQFVIDGYVEVPRDQYAEFSRKWISQAARVLKPGGSIYIVSGYSNLYYILDALKQTDLEERNHIIWKYNFGVFTTNKYIASHYHILYYIKKGGDVTFNTYNRFGVNERDHKQRSLNYQDREDVWVINREYKPGRVKNKNELPEALLSKMLLYSSNPGDLILDFFLGGFSTARAALSWGRRICGFEINARSFNLNHASLKEIDRGAYLVSQKKVDKKLPENQRKRWTDAEINHLSKKFKELAKKPMTKRQLISELQKEFGRGYFSILNKISEISNP